MTVAFEIKSPFKDKKGDNNTLITIWHVDPQKDGTDDSCGWVMRARHGDKEILKRIKEDFAHHLKNQHWFKKSGEQQFSTIGLLTNMYRIAAYHHFKNNQSKTNEFLRKYAYDFIYLAENPFDCLGDIITNKFDAPRREHRDELKGLAGIIYADILNKDRKWYQHSKWHIHHWKIQLVFLRGLKRAKKTNNG